MRPIQSRVLYGASRLHTECFITHRVHIVHAIANLLCSSSIKHKSVLYDKGSSAVQLKQHGYSSFDPPTQNTSIAWPSNSEYHAYQGRLHG